MVITTEGMHVSHSAGLACRVPEECPQEVAELIDHCCASETKERPTALEVMRIVGRYLDRDAQS